MSKKFLIKKSEVVIAARDEEFTDDRIKAMFEWHVDTDVLLLSGNYGKAWTQVHRMNYEG